MLQSPSPTQPNLELAAFCNLELYRPEPGYPTVEAAPAFPVSPGKPSLLGINGSASPGKEGPVPQALHVRHLPSRATRPSA